MEPRASLAREAADAAPPDAGSTDAAPAHAPPAAALAHLVDALPSGVAAVDAAGTQVYVNDAFARMIGWPREELIGATPPFPYWPPEEIDAIGAAFQETVRGEAAGAYDLRFMRRDGARVDVRVAIAPLPAGAGWVASVTELSDVRAAEAALRDREDRLRLALDAGRLGAWEYDIASGRVTWSATLERIHGIPEGSFGGTFEDYQRDMHPEDRDHVLATIAKTSHGEGEHLLQYRIIRPDGEVRWLEARGQLLTDAEGNPVRMVGVCSDATDRKLAEDAVRAAKEDAEQANRSKADFLAAMSHELRTPLNAIAGYVDLLDLGIHGAVTDAQREALGRTRENQRRLLRLINDILHYAKLEAGHLELEPRAFDLAEALHAMEPLIGPQARARGIAYACEPPPAGATAWGDPERVEQILLNLLSNAVKFTAHGGHVTLSCDVAPEAVRVHVRDDGRGIPADRLESVFDPFVQLDRRRSEDSAQGVGLGLAISRDLARGMRGDVLVESEPGKGSTFTLVLPTAAGEEDGGA